MPDPSRRSIGHRPAEARRDPAESARMRLSVWCATITAAFVALVPLATLLLLWMKGFPSFASEHVLETLLWVYQVTALPAALAGLLTAVLIRAILRRTHFFHRPFDMGRCFSLGAITGALCQGLATWVYRGFSHRPFSGFWLAGAIMAGFLAAGVIIPAVIRLHTRKP